jgi:hypothetical protein
VSNHIKQFGHYLLDKPLATYLTVAVVYLASALGVPIAWLGEIIIALITLRLGFYRGSQVALAAFVPLALAFLFFVQHSVIVFEAYALAWIIVFALVLRWTKGWGPLLLFSAIIAMVHVVSVQLFYPEITQFWLTQLHSAVDHSAFFKNTDPKQQKQMFDYLASIATGFTATFIVVGQLTVLLLARWWQASLFNPGGLRQELTNISMPFIGSIGLMMIYFGTLYWPGLFNDLIITATYPFTLSGLSLLHFYAERQNYGKFLLISVYLLFVTMFFIMLNLLAFISVIDSYIDLRQKIRDKLANKRN